MLTESPNKTVGARWSPMSSVSLPGTGKTIRARLYSEGPIWVARKLLSEKRIRCPVCNRPIITPSGETFIYLFQSCASLGAWWFPTNQAPPSNFSSSIYTNKLPDLQLSPLHRLASDFFIPWVPPLPLKVLMRGESSFSN